MGFFSTILLVSSLSPREHEAVNLCFFFHKTFKNIFLNATNILEYSLIYR